MFPISTLVLLVTDGPCIWENFALEKQEQEMDEEREHKSKDLKMLPYKL